MGATDFLIAGAGVIGLSLALELDRRGAAVTVLESGAAMRQTSAAAAGMLAVNDPANPPALYPLAQHSAALYPQFLARLAELSGIAVPFQTSVTLESCAKNSALEDPRQIMEALTANPPPLRLLEEHSVDPRQLGEALRAAVANTRVHLCENAPLERLAVHTDSVSVASGSANFRAATFIDCMGTWSPAPVVPRKGQMLAVLAPEDCHLTCVLRTDDVYIVPRTSGPDRGRLIIGATIEDAGFDLSVRPKDILALNQHAVALLPALAHAAFLESWSGLRPATSDGLPILGATPSRPRYVVATGHFRNGILLAPATAHVIADLLLGVVPALDLTPFSPGRFAPSGTPAG